MSAHTLVRFSVRRVLVSLSVLVILCAGGCSGGGTRPTITPPPSTLTGVAAEQIVTFTADGDTVYGTFESPTGASASHRVPAAVIIAGSGPTDRDGNSTIVKGRIDTLKEFASVLASHGVASLRYDKLGTGKTGLASYASHPADIGFDVYVDEASAALTYLGTRPDVDAQRVIILGHSEGALIAMVVGVKLPADALAALVLAAPPGSGYLETLAEQLRAQYAAAVGQGTIAQAKADAALADVDRIVASLKQNGSYPADMTLSDPSLSSVFSAGNEHFFGQVERYVPVELAAQLPPSLPVLLLHGGKDQQISADDTSQLRIALKDHPGATESDDIPNTDHVFKDVPGTPNAATDYTNPSLQFSPEAADKLGAFLDSVFATSP